MANTHIWHGRNQSSHHDKMAQPLHLTYSSEWLWIQHSYLTWKEPILSPWQNGSALTSDHGRNQSSHHVRMAHGLISSFWKEPRSWEHQASPWSTQNSLWLMASSTHHLSVHSLQYIGASLLSSAPYPWYSDAWSRYDLTCHGTQGSLTTSHNSGCHNIYK